MRTSPTLDACPRCTAQAADNALLRQQITRLHAEVARLQAQVKTLQAQLSQTSANAQKPPSSDPPTRARVKVRELSPRQRGGQPSHPGTTRALRPVAEVAELQVCQPTPCASCGSPLTGSDPAPLRHQVTELPPLKPTGTESQLQALGCGQCGAVTRAPLPEGVPERAYGLRLPALGAVLSGAYRLSKRNIEQLLADGLGVERALGASSALARAPREALPEPVAAARRFGQPPPVGHVDETGGREANRRAWLWTAVPHSVTVFVIRRSRGSQVAKELGGAAFAGVLVSDRGSGDRWGPIKQPQLCGAQLIRDLPQLAAAGGAAGAMGEALGMGARPLCHWWPRVRDGTLPRSSFCVSVVQLRIEVRALLREGALCKDAKSAALCRSLLQHEPALWTFVREEGVEPTNNPAEVRPPARGALAQGELWNPESRRQ